MDTEVKEALETFFDRAVEPSFIFKTDRIWPEAAQEQLAGKSEEFQIAFWIELEKEFKKKEKAIGHIHKGGIYWALANLLLIQGDLTKAINYLDDSVAEDREIGNQFSAAIGFSSILKPLVYRFKKDQWKFDETIMQFYESLSIEERREFASRLLETHNQVISSQIVIIKEEFFHFIADESIRRVVHDSYIELKDILLNIQLKTYFSCLFSAGSILEGMLDDLFLQNSQMIWQLFQSNSKIQEKISKDSRLRKTDDYDAGLTLGEKIFILRMLIEHGSSPIPRVPILQMLIIAEYRDLIHPRRRTGFGFEANRYVASVIFTFISHIAGSWWPENIHKTLRASNST